MTAKDNVKSTLGRELTNPFLENDKRLRKDLRSLNLAPLTSIILTAFIVVFCTWLIDWFEIFANDRRPFTLIFIVPVAFAAAFLGTRGGLLTALVSIVISRVYLYDTSPNVWQLPPFGVNVELFALAFGLFTVAVVTGRLRTVLGELNKANIDLRDSERRRRSFNKEVLLAVTGGRLSLCDDEELCEMMHGDALFTMPLDEPVDASKLRHAIKDSVAGRNMTQGRLDDICTAATEAATNAVKYGSGGKAKVWVGDGTVSVLVSDHGSGISPAQLARATLERGYSTRVSLGMGYYIMLEAVDSMALSTSPDGTSILLFVGAQERVSREQSLLAQYSAL